MAKKSGVRVTASTGNVFRDIGFSVGCKAETIAQSRVGTNEPSLIRGISGSS